MIERLGDIMRFWWGLLYWNARKSMFRLRGRRARCPCQNPSDSGRALETACEAAHDWSAPVRFRRVCPLLVDTPAGLRCSVDTKDVRAFWGRAAAYWLSAAAGIGLIAALGVFAVLRLVGYPISPLAVIWPARWHELRLAKSEYFVAKARHALDAQQVREAILSLAIAYQENPRNYNAGLQLAQLTSIGQPDYADPVFAKLMRDFPDQRAVTSEVWFRSLLIHGRFSRVAELAAVRLLDDRTQKAVWLHALFNATRLGGNDQPLRDLLERHAAKLEPIDIALINSELQIRHGQGLELLPGLTTELPPSAGPYALFFQVSRLDSLGRHAAALALLDRYSAAHRVTEADEFQLRLGLLAGLGRQDLLRARLAQGPINAREFELVSVHLVRHPDRATLAALDACLKRSNLPADRSTYCGYTAFLAACGVANDWDRMHAAAGVLQQIAATHAARFDTIEAFFRKNVDRVDKVLPLLPAPSLDLIYALYDRYDERPP